MIAALKVTVNESCEIGQRCGSQNTLSRPESPNRLTNWTWALFDWVGIREIRVKAKVFAGMSSRQPGTKTTETRSIGRRTHVDDSLDGAQSRGDGRREEELGREGLQIALST